MGARQRSWARRERDRLYAILGGKCERCGAVEELTLDCKIPMGTAHHRIEWSHRISFYRAMLAVKNLALLCNTCNAAKGNRVTILTRRARAKIAAQLAAAAWPVPAELRADLPPTIEPGAPDQNRS